MYYTPPPICCTLTIFMLNKNLLLHPMHGFFFFFCKLKFRHARAKRFFSRKPSPRAYLILLSLNIENNFKRTCARDIFIIFKEEKKRESTHISDRIHKSVTIISAFRNLYFGYKSTHMNEILMN